MERPGVEVPAISTIQGVLVGGGGDKLAVVPVIAVTPHPIRSGTTPI